MTEVSSVANTVLTTLDIGSGIDSTKLARDLTDAVQIPQTQIAQGKIDASEASISAYALVKFQVDKLKASFEKLNDANELATSSGVSSDATKMTLSAVAGSAAAGSYDFTIESTRSESTCRIRPIYCKDAIFEWWNIFWYFISSWGNPIGSSSSL